MAKQPEKAASMFGGTTNVNVHLANADALHQIQTSLDSINSKLEKLMASLADVQAAVTAEDTVVDSAIALLQGLAAAVAALQPNQAAIDALAADITSKTDALAQAVAANTPTP